MLKRFYDLTLVLTVGVIAMPVWVPLLAFVGAIMWLTDRGPVFYIQDRLGKGGSVFRIVKIRTMVKCAERSTGPVWAAPSDGRITRIGGFLRKTHWDELPQVWNVVRGEMSLVGPRPERPELAELFEARWPGFSDRLAVLPGIAALSHVYGDSFTTPRNRLRYDRIYIANMGWWLDTKVIGLCVWKSWGLAVCRNGRARGTATNR